ncbi:hypothetical protein SAMN05446935_7505 [Burkholderia sp. YR290]|nr:hypothetical protein SAMN05446935_7505 [Burkholderia sp. YR290]
MKYSDLFEVRDIAPRPACSVDGTWYALADAGALIHVDGEPYILDLHGDRQACAPSLWRLLERKKLDIQREETFDVAVLCCVLQADCRAQQSRITSRLARSCWCRPSFAQSPYGPYPASRSCRIDSMITCESEHT